MKRVFYVLALVALLITAAACSVSFSTANITNASMTTAMVNGKPSDSVTSYSADAPEFVASAILKNAPDDTIVTFVWYYKGQEAYRVPFDANGESEIYVYSTLTTQLDQWPAGDYKVEMYINEREKPDATVEFTVE